MKLPAVVESTTLRALLALPDPAKRLLAGRPVLIDGQTLAVDSQLLLRLRRVARVPAVETLPVVEARQAMLDQAVLAGGRQRIGAVRDLDVDGHRARHYLPTGAATAGTPLLVWFHGGGFVYGDLESHDAPCRFLAERSGVPVLSVEYRLGPEAPFPAAHRDAASAYRWVVEHADDLGADPQRIGVGGDSAGGCLAGWTAIAAARERVPVAWQLLLYPTVDPHHENYESYRLFGDGFFLTKEFIAGASAMFTQDPADYEDERRALVKADLPTGLAPAYVATAGFDPLRDEGEAYARKLEAAGVEVESERFDDQIHGFVNLVGAGRTTPAAVARIADRLRAALG